MRRIVYALLGFLIGFGSVHLAAAGEHNLILGNPPRHVTLTEDRAPGEARGTIVLTTGEAGTAPYRGQWRDQTKADLLALGFDLWQVTYTDPNGWITNGSGMGYRGAMAVYQDAVAYIQTHCRSPHLGAAGNSGGAFQILYAMEAGVTFNVVIPSGVPFASHRSVPDPNEVFCWGDDRTGFLFGWPNGTCRGSGNYTTAQIAKMDADAVLTGAWAVKNAYLLASGGNERDATALQRLYAGLGKPKKRKLCSGTAHDVDNTQCGHDFIVGVLNNRMPD